MKKLTLAHSEAIGTAKLSMIRLSDQATTPKFKQVVEKQIDLLSELNWWVLHSIYEPGLPVGDGGNSNGSKDGSTGH